jgi:membrane-associated phospholipid phosphatase
MPTNAARRVALILAAALSAHLALAPAYSQSAPTTAAATPAAAQVASTRLTVSSQPVASQDPPAPKSSLKYGLPIRYPHRQGFIEQTAGDAAAYFTAPLHWNARDWEYFGGALGAIAIAHHYDTQARNHFDSGYRSPLGPPNSGSLTDALPGAALFVATWGYATLIHSHAGHLEAWNMLESGGLSFVSAYALKYIFRRQRPDATTSPNHWFGGGDSFPSEHVTAAFAVGTVLAESGNPKFRWIRRTIGYGVGIFTAYQRLKHNAHWLSDTVAGAALGMATAHFVMDRSNARERQDSSVSVVPVPGGVMLAYSASFDD